MANGRRIIFGTHLVPKETADREEIIPQKWTIMRQDNLGNVMTKTMGGKGICTDINATQWSDSWTSMAHQDTYWENWADSDDISGNRWEDAGYWDGIVTLTTSPQGLSGDGSDLSFCYIKNRGDTNTISVSINGTGGNYYILIPPGGSVHFRGGDNAFNCDQVFMKAVSGSTTAEYIIAQK
jgi:hypothetical protein